MIHAISAITEFNHHNFRLNCNMSKKNKNRDTLLMMEDAQNGMKQEKEKNTMRQCFKAKGLEKKLQKKQKHKMTLVIQLRKDEKKSIEIANLMTSMTESGQLVDDNIRKKQAEVSKRVSRNKQQIKVLKKEIADLKQQVKKIYEEEL